MDWLHCNNCYCLPTASSTFCFSSCGHIICLKCLDQVGTPTMRSLCRVCKKPATFMKINRNLKPQLQMYFTPPKDLAGEYAKNLKTVINFQSHHRSRLQKFQQEKLQKATKYCKEAKTEITKRIGKERAAVAEYNQLKMELDEKIMYAQNLENMVVERDKEIERLSTKQSPFKRKTGVKIHPSLNGTTPITSMSFGACATSTPLDNMGTLFYQQTIGDNIENLLNTPAAYESPIAGSVFPINTPALLGISQHRPERRSSSMPNKTGDGGLGMGTFF